MGLSNFASKPVEEVVAANPRTLFQMYWTGDREVMVERMERARAAGAIGLIATLDWSFSIGRDWGSPEIPEKVDLRTMLRMAPEVALARDLRPQRAAARPERTEPGTSRAVRAGVLRRLLRVDEHPTAHLGG